MGYEARSQARIVGANTAVSELHFQTIAELSELVRLRKLSPLELTDALLRRIETIDPQVHAFVTVTAARARAQAKAAESEIAAGRYRGPLHGIPFALKDIYDTRGILTSAHSRICINRVPDEDATVVRKLDEAGAVLLGKLSTHEFAMGGPAFDLPWPPARNPWRLEHFTGGSSSGSGAAVAAGMVPAALGTDTGGSIRAPASFCGITGIKPTFGLVSRAGVIPNSYTFDHCGPMAWTVEDCAILLQAIAGYDPGDAGSVRREISDYRSSLRMDLKGLRIGVLRHNWEEDLPASEDVRLAMDEALKVLAGLGATIEECRMRSIWNYWEVKITIAVSEILGIHQKDLVARADHFSSDFLGRVLPAVVFTSMDYVQATREHRRMITELEPLYGKYDAFITAGQGEAPRIDAHRALAFWQKANLYTASNTTGQPALQLCNGFGRNGLPLGMQVLGRPFGEAVVFRVGHAYEKATAWRGRRPALVPDAVAPPVTPPPVLAGAPDPGPEVRDICAKAVARSGFGLNDTQFAQLLEGAPYSLDIAQRLYRDHGYYDQPANAFRLPGNP